MQSFAPRDQAFGKKANAIQTASDSTRLRPIALFVVALALFATAGGAFAWVQKNRDLYAAWFDPAALGELTLRADHRRVKPVWDVTGPHDEVLQTVTWTTVKLRDICGHKGYPFYTTDLDDYQKANVRARNRYLPEIYGAGPADSVVAQIANNAKEFCAQEYYFAMYDARNGLHEPGEARRAEFLAGVETNLAMISASAAGPSVKTRAPTEPDMNIDRYCREQWGTDYRMQVYCRNKQQDARQWARSRNISNDVAARCAREWPSDWTMYVYCAKKQEEAKAKL